MIGPAPSSTPLRAQAPLPGQAAAPAAPSIDKTAEAFEAIILRQMLATVRQTKLADDIFGSSATDNFREIADARLADTLAARGVFGIARLVEQQLQSNGKAQP